MSFVRHGEAHHNVAQREWHEAGKPGEPYTLDTDPEFKLLDPTLTELGHSQARALQERAAALGAEVVFASPMRRATQTALIGFEKAEGLPKVAHELLHECGGKHTCDKRRSIRDLSAEFPQLDYSQLVCEEDPYWGDGRTRENLEKLSERGAAFLAWLHDRPEQCVAVVGHSAWLFATFNAAVDVEQAADEAAEERLRSWFETGEMRTVLLARAAGVEAEAPAPEQELAAEGDEDVEGEGEEAAGDDQQEQPAAEAEGQADGDAMEEEDQGQADQGQAGGAEDATDEETARAEADAQTAAAKIAKKKEALEKAAAARDAAIRKKKEADRQKKEAAARKKAEKREKVKAKAEAKKAALRAKREKALEKVKAAREKIRQFEKMAKANKAVMKKPAAASAKKSVAKAVAKKPAAQAAGVKKRPAATMAGPALKKRPAAK